MVCIKVKTREHLALFDAFPPTLYDGSQASYAYTQVIEESLLVDRYLVLRHDAVVGRASLFYNPLLKLNKKVTYQVGQYEAIDDQKVASLLFRTIETDIKSRGGNYILGPMHGSTLYNYRFNLNDEPLIFTEAYHHLYYNAHFISVGMTEYAGYYTDKSTEVVGQKIDKNLLNAFANMGITIRPIQMENYLGELKKLYGLVSEAFAKNHLYTPFSEKDFIVKYTPLKDYINPDLFLLAENQEGKVIGVYLCFEDYYNPEDKSVIIKSLARDADPLYKGLGRVMGSYILNYCQEHGYKATIHAMIYEQGFSRDLSSYFKGRKYKNYMLYGKEI